jgi:hypothetical protein
MVFLSGRTSSRAASRRIGSGASPRASASAPLVDADRLLLLALDRGQRRAQRVGRRGAVAASALAIEVDRCAVQPEQQARRLDRRRRVAVVVVGEAREVELVLRRALPEEVEVDRVGVALRLLHQLGGRRLGEAQQHRRRLDLGALAARGLDLQAGAGVGEDGARLERAVFLEQDVGARHGTVRLPVTRPAPPSGRL